MSSPKDSPASCLECGGLLDPTLPGGGCGACLWGEMIRGEMQGQADSASWPRIPGYEILAEAGRGGMGVVYRARQHLPAREVALKIVVPGSLRATEERRRFQLEVEAMAALTHPGILPLYETGEDDHGRAWFTMLLAEGGTLADRVAALQGNWRHIAALVVGLASAVQYAHQRGILHRDLKPANIIFDLQDRAYVADFGLAKWADSDAGLTQSTHMLLGSPSYLAPEAASGGARSATTANDVYGLGAILYELLTGVPPYTGTSAVQVVTDIIAGPPPAPRQIFPGIPRDLEVIAQTAMAREAPRRYASAAALAEDLTHWLEGRPILARPVSTVERSLIWARRNPALAALLAVIAVGVGAITILTQTANRRLANESEVSRRQAILAREAEARALESGRAARRSAYLSDMYAAAQSRLGGNYAATRRLLAAHVPAEGAEDLRGIEWRILFHQSKPDLPQYSFQVSRPVQALTAPQSGTHFWTVDQKEVRAWNVATMKEEPEWVPSTHPNGIPAAAFRLGPTMESWQAAAKLASPSLYEANSEEDFRRAAGLEGGLLNHPTDVQCAADGTWLAIATERWGVSIWENKDRKLLRVLPGSFALLSLSNDGRRMALTCDARAHGPFGTFVYDTSTWQPLSFVPNTGFTVNISPDGTRLATNRGLLDALTGSVTQQWKTGGSDCFAFSPDGKYVATNDWAGDTVIYDISAWECIRRLPSAARCLAFSPDGKLLAAGGLDHAVRTWDWNFAGDWRPWRGHDAVVTSVAWSPKGQVYSAGADGKINVWDRFAAVVIPPDVPLENVAGDLPGKGLILCRNHAEALSLFDPATAAFRATVPLPPAICGLRFTSERNSLLFITAPDGAPARLVRMALPSGKIERETSFAGPLSPGHTFISADGSRLAIVGEKGVREAWDGLTGALLHRSTTSRNIPGYAAFSPDGKTLWEFGANSGFSAWAWPDWRPLWRKDHVQGRLFFDDRVTLVACAQEDGAVTVYRMSDGEKLGTFTGHSTQVYDVGFSPDGKQLVTTDEREARLWDLPTMREAANLGPFRYVKSIRFTADGTRLIVHSPGRAPELLPP